MKPDGRYLSSAVPSPEKLVDPKNGTSDAGRLSSLEEQIAAMIDNLAKQNRDALDAQYNVDEENLSESLLVIIRDLQKRVKALEDAAAANENAPNP